MFQAGAADMVVCVAAGEGEGQFWQRPWRLRAAVVYGWRGHRQRLTALASHPNEQLVATAGRGHVGGQDQEVVRCWSLATAATGFTHSSLFPDRANAAHLHLSNHPVSGSVAWLCKPGKHTNSEFSFYS